MGKLWDLGDRGSSLEYQSLDAPGEKRQQKAAALTLMGGSLPKEEARGEARISRDFPMCLFPSCGCKSCSQLRMPGLRSSEWG